MTAPWNNVTTGTPPGSVPHPRLEDPQGYLHNWVPASIHQMETLNEVMDPLSILEDIHLKHQLDTQLPLNDNEPLVSQSGTNISEPSSVTPTTEINALSKYNPYNILTDNIQGGEQSYYRPGTENIKHQIPVSQVHAQNHAANAALVFPNQYAVPSQKPSSTPSIVVPALASSPSEDQGHVLQQQWSFHQQQQHPHSQEPESSPSAAASTFKSAALTPVSSPLGSPPEPQWKTNTNTIAGYFDIDLALFNDFQAQRKKDDSENDDTLSIPRHREQSTTSSTTTTTTTEHDDNSTSHNGADTSDSATKDKKKDKRQRNTVASARFRIKKKLREQTLQKTAYEMTEKSRRLEAYVCELEKEIRWLKALVVEKNEASVNSGSSSNSSRPFPGNNNDKHSSMFPPSIL